MMKRVWLNDAWDGCTRVLPWMEGEEKNSHAKASISEEIWLQQVHDVVWLMFQAKQSFALWKFWIDFAKSVKDEIF